MSAYMRNQFPFLGLKARDRRDAAKWFVKNARHAAVSEIWDAADGLWAEPEREFQYVGSDMLRRWAGRFGPDDIGRVETLIVTKSWWDTVDTLAADTVGTMVANHPTLVEVMDRWVEHENLWLIRTAIIHQLKRRDTIDAERLFAYADRLAAHTDFFIRKAIGWALRQHGRSDPDAVRSFVAARTATLSGLTKREALKHLS